MRLRLRQRGAERILQRRVDEHELGLGGFGGGRQRVHIQAVVAARDADGDAAVVAYQRQQVAVAGVFDQHRVARLGQRAQDQVEGVGGAVGQQDLLRPDREQLVRQRRRQVLAQRRKAQRMAGMRMAWRTASRMVSSPYHSGGSQPAPTGSASETPEYSSGVSASMATGVACIGSGSSAAGKSWRATK